MRSLSLTLILTCVWCVAYGTATAQAAAPQIENVAPAVGQRGAAFSLRLVGAGLADAAEIMLYSPSVTSVGMTSATDNDVSFQLRAAADCPLGSHAFRVRTKQGISELHTFRVTALPVISEAEPNGSLAEAQTVAANVTIAGVITAGDVDCFQIALRRGDRLAAEVEAIRLGGTMLDTVLTVYGPDGQQIASVDDTSLFRQDPFVSIVVPEDGRYVVQVRETNYNGDDASRYALHLGSFPRPTFVYPAGGQAGRTMTVRFGGDAMGGIDQEIRLPDAPRHQFGLFAVHQGLTSPTPNPFRVSSFGNILESEPNDNASNAGSTAAELPIAFNGILERAGDVDYFRFAASQGARYQFETFASRLGSPIDSVISIADAAGNVIVSNDDDGTHDSRLIFVAPQAGEYVLCVTDKRGEGGDNFVYRVEASEPGPKLLAFLPRPDRKSQDRQTIVVPRGNRVLALLAAQRTGLEGDVRLVASDLPAGVSFSEAIVSANRFAVPVVVESGAEAALGGRLAKVLATGSADGQVVTGGFIQVVDLVAGSADALFQSFEVDRLAIAVVEEYPFSISLDELKTALPRDGTIGFQIRVVRNAGFDGPVDVAFPLLPPWVDGPATITIPPDQSTAVYTARSFAQAEPQTWPLCAEALPGRAAARGATDTAPGASAARRRRGKRADSPPATSVSTQLVSLQISESPVTGTIGTVAAEQGRQLKVVCQIKRHGQLPSQMTATLEGLPNRVSVSPVAVTEEVERVDFTLKLEPTAPVGSFSSLVCRLAGKIDGQEVSYIVGRGSVLKIEPAGGLIVDENGRPLSALEALRRAKRKSNDKDSGNHE